MECKTLYVVFVCFVGAVVGNPAKMGQYGQCLTLSYLIMLICGQRLDLVALELLFNMQC